jgi:hypothetical protein
MISLAQISLGSPLMHAIEQVESGGNPRAIGDGGKAIGILQIHAACVADVNRAYALKWKHASMADVYLSRIVFQHYLELYATEARIGRPVTDEDRARIWQSGPDGWKKDCSIPYWNKVKAVMEGSR